jgi:transposase
MKTNYQSNTSTVRGEQVTNNVVSTALPESIYLGIDLHKASITVTRILDHSTPQPAQKFDWGRFWVFAEKQTTLAKNVYACYEAGAFGFWVARKLKKMGIECFVVHPEKLDPHHKRVQTDKLDSRHLADKLQRYVLGNQRAMVPVYIPSEAEEQQRLESRHRESLVKALRCLKRRGAGLLLGQGIFQTHQWWTTRAWEKLAGCLCPQLQMVLEEDQALIQDLEQRVRKAEKKLAASAPTELPKGFGRLSFVLLLREICNYQRFHSRRNVGGFTGLCGAVSSSGPYHLDLSINKAGNPYLRVQLVELAWRMTYWQPTYTGLKAWNQLHRSSGGLRNRRRRKIAIVAVARQLAVDLWKWQTGRITPKELGWEMSSCSE